MAKVYDTQALKDFLINNQDEYDVGQIKDVEKHRSGFVVSFFGEGGPREILFTTGDEAYEEAERILRDDIEDLGLDLWTEHFKERIFRDHIESYWFEEFLEESFSNYVEDIKNEPDEVYGNRLAKEMVSSNLINIADFTDSEGNINKEALTEFAEENSEQYSDVLIRDAGDPVEYFRDNFGEDQLQDVVKKHNLVDWSSVIEEAIEEDGVAHTIGSYDGTEYLVNDDYNAYRIG